MKERKIVLQILGIHCAACAQGIESGLARLDGIIDAKVNFTAKEAIVKFNGEKATQDQTEPFLGPLLQCHNDPLAAGVLYPSLMVLIPPQAAAASMIMSDITVVANSMLLSRWKP